MQEIEIFFDSKTKLTWKLRDHDVAKKWFMCLLRTMIESQYFQPRFSGFEKNSKTESKLIAQLRKIREIINQTGEFHIKESIPDILDRDMLNILHHYFEEFFYNPRFNYHIKNQNTHITGPILSLNHNVHDLEFLLKNQKNIDSFENPVRSITFELLDYFKAKLTDQEILLFDLNCNFGDIYLSYPRVGKTMLEVFLDKDEYIKDEAIAPIDSISSGFLISFSKARHDYKIKEEFDSFLKTNNKDPNDPTLKNGNISLAYLDSEKSEEEVIEEVSHFDRIHRFIMKNNKQVLLDREIGVENRYLEHTL